MEVDGEDYELQARIANLAARINRHRSSDYAMDGTGMECLMPGRSRPLTYAPHQDSHSSWSMRGPRYGSYRGHGRGVGPPTHRHRTLVIKNNTGGNATDCPRSTSGGENGWVTRNDRHMQIINNSVYGKEIQERADAMEKTRLQKQQRRHQQERFMLNEHLHTTQRDVPRLSANTTAHYVSVNSIRFFVAEGGSKLIRTDGMIYLPGKPQEWLMHAQDESNKFHTTPKRANIGGVTFHRSKTGNLYRAGLVKIQRCASPSKAKRSKIHSRLTSVTENEEGHQRATSPA